MRVLLFVVAAVMSQPALAAAQARGWTADVSVGWAGLVDDATKHYVVLGGSVRRHVSPRVSVGPEIVLMTGGGGVRDRNVMLTGNVVVDALAPGGRRAVVPFVVAGAGVFWGRDQVAGGPYWSSDPAFTAGAGVRVPLGDAAALSAEYRLGWELHQRLSAGVGVRW